MFEPRPFHRKIASLVVACCLCLAASPLRAASPIYEELMAEFSRHPHRLPGSAEFNQSLDTLETVLRRVGLQPRRQTFNTLVPVMRQCRFTVGGRDIGPLHALAPNGAALVTTGGQSLVGPVIYAGSGQLSELRGLPVDGAIVLLDLGSPRLLDMFSLGAKAVIYIGNGQPGPSQWEMWTNFTEMPAEQPRFYLNRAVAESAGLLATERPVTGSIVASAAWIDMIATNLWVELPAKEPAIFELGRDEVIVLQATLDTFGTVPTANPQLREAANCALLAETLVRLAAQPRQRAIFAVFTGSYYQQQEGSRYFYYGVSHAERDHQNFDPLDERDTAYLAQLATTNAKLTLLERPNFLAQSDPELFAVGQTLRQRTDKKVNDFNFELRDVNRVLASDPTTAGLRAHRDSLTEAKAAWNALRPQLNRRVVAPESAALFSELVAAYRGDLLRQRDELETMRRHLASTAEIAKRFVGRTVVGHYSFDFSSDAAPWFPNPLGANDEFLREKTFIGLYLKSLAVHERIHERVAVPAWSSAPLFRPALTGAFNPEFLTTPRERVLPSTPACTLGITAYTLVTVGDALLSDHLPVRGHWSLDGLAPQMAEYVAALSRAPELSMRPALNRQRIEPKLTGLMRGGTFQGYRLMKLATGTTNLEGPLAGAVVVLAGPTEDYGKLPAIGRLALSRSDANGALFVPNIRAHSMGSRPTNQNGYEYDAHGRIISVGYDRFQIHDQTFKAWGGTLYIPFRPDNYDLNLKPLVLGGRNNAAFNQERIWTGDDLAVIYTGEVRPAKFVLGGLLLTHGTADHPAGQGFALNDGMLYRLDTIRRSAADYHALNQARLQALRARNYFNEALEQLHAGAERHLALAGTARVEQDTARARGHDTFAVALGQRAYEPIKRVVSDMVAAVIILLLLSVPFAFFLERLLCGFASVYRQIGGFCGFFIATFTLLYFTHPAFALAEAPVVIFLAFVILLLSTLVIWLVLAKFKLEVMALQGLASRTHSAEKAGGSVLASVVIGISGMRNRPLKTSLTSFTIVLLTFTILVFSSFSSELGVVSQHAGTGAGPERIEVHRANLLPMPEPLVDSLRSLYGARYHVLTRATVSDDPKLNEAKYEQLLLHPASGRTVRLQGLVGFDPAELALQSGWEKIVPPSALHQAPGELPPLFLSPAVTARLGAKAGDELSVRGTKFRFAGETDSAALSKAAHLDQTRVLPPDFILSLPVQSNSTTDNEVTNALNALNAGTFIYADPTEVAVSQVAALRPVRIPRLGGVTTAVTLYPREGLPPSTIRRDATDIARVFQGPIWVKSGDGTHRLLFTTTMRGAGFQQLLVPLSLGGLIIFASLLGSIVDREREIMTYSALGLDPVDVGALFFAESAVYAVIGGMGGYLVGQTAGSLMLGASRLWGFDPLAINFSSLSSIYTILLVMLTVFLSTIYPARRAGRLANPGVARKWRMPKPDGDRLRFVFPFTVSARDTGGILAFLREHFENHRDASLGQFAAREVRLGHEGGPRLDAEVSLAPFDLGVFQRFRLGSQPSEITGIDEVVVELERLSGPANAWRRSNRRFINSLREQFLLWRSLPPETMDHYRTSAATSTDEKTG